MPFSTLFLHGHSVEVQSVAWSPDGHTIAAGSFANAILLWEASSGQQLRKLEGHSDPVGSVAWSPDGRTLASGSKDHTILLWETNSGRQPRKLEGHNDVVWSVAWSPDGQTLASESGNTLVLWDMDLESWKSHACRIANRNLTRAEWVQYIDDIEPYRATCPRLPIEGETAKN
jgi:WD40 repeat protein